MLLKIIYERVLTLTNGEIVVNNFKSFLQLYNREIHLYVFYNITMDNTDKFKNSFTVVFHIYIYNLKKLSLIKNR